MSNGATRTYDLASITSVPALATQWTEAILPLTAGSAGTFLVTTTPVSSILGIWNFLFSIYVDLPGSGGGHNLSVDLPYIFPDGTALTSAMRNLTLTNWLDWAESSDSSNVRVHKIRIANTDVSDHTYTLRYKGYTSSGVGGTGT